MGNVAENSVLVRSERIDWRQYNKGVVIEPGLALNETAARFFLELDGVKPVSAIVAEIGKDYDVRPDELSRDTLSLADEMLEAGVVEFVS